MQTNVEAPHNATLEIVRISADGTRTSLGVVDAHYDNPIRQLWWDTVGRRLAKRRIERYESGR